MSQEQPGTVSTTSQARSAPVRRFDGGDRKPATEPLPCSQKSQTEGVPMSKGAETVPPPPEPMVAEKSKSKQKSSCEVNGVPHQLEPPQSQPTSLQAVMDAEIAQQQATKSTAGGTKSWADCVRGTQGPQISELIRASTHPPPQQSPIGQNEHRDHQPLRGKPAHLREPRDHRPARPTFSEGEANSGRSGPRGGFRNSGRGRGNGGVPFRGYF